MQYLQLNTLYYMNSLGKQFIVYLNLHLSFNYLEYI